MNWKSEEEESMWLCSLVKVSKETGKVYSHGLTVVRANDDCSIDSKSSRRPARRWWRVMKRKSKQQGNSWQRNNYTDHLFKSASSFIQHTHEDVVETSKGRYCAAIEWSNDEHQSDSACRGSATLGNHHTISSLFNFTCDNQPTEFADSSTCDERIGPGQNRTKVANGCVKWWEWKEAPNDRMTTNSSLQDWKSGFEVVNGCTT